MSRTLLVAAAMLAASAGHAQVTLGKKRTPTTTTRITDDRPRFFDDLVFLSQGASLTLLRPGGKRWETVAQAGQGKCQAASYDAARKRLLVGCSDRNLYVVGLGGRDVVTLPTGTIPLGKAELAADGRSVLVFGDFHQVHRLPLEGGSEPVSLAPERFGSMIFTSPWGAIFAEADRGNRGCDPKAHDCVIRLIQYRIDGAGFSEKAIAPLGEGRPFRAVPIPGGDARFPIFAIAPRASAGDSQAQPTHLVRFDMKTGELSELDVPAPPDTTLRPASLTRTTVRASQATEELVQVYVRGNDLAVRTSSLKDGRETGLIYLPAPLLAQRPPPLWGFDFADQGGIWVHWLDSLYLIDREHRVTEYDVRYLMKEYGKVEVVWAEHTISGHAAGSVWVGIDLPGGRHYHRVDLRDVRKRGRPARALSRESYQPQSCTGLPPDGVLMGWPLHGVPAPCTTDFAEGYYPDSLRIDVVRELPDGTQIINYREEGCFRVMPRDC